MIIPTSMRRPVDKNKHKLKPSRLQIAFNIEFREGLSMHPNKNMGGSSVIPVWFQAVIFNFNICPSVWLQETFVPLKCSDFSSQNTQGEMPWKWQRMSIDCWPTRREAFQRWTVCHWCTSTFQYSTTYRKLWRPHRQQTRIAGDGAELCELWSSKLRLSPRGPLRWRRKWLTL